MLRCFSPNLLPLIKLDFSLRGGQRFSSLKLIMQINQVTLLAILEKTTYSNFKGIVRKFVETERNAIELTSRFFYVTYSQHCFKYAEPIEAIPKAL